MVRAVVHPLVLGRGGQAGRQRLDPCRDLGHLVAVRPAAGHDVGHGPQRGAQPVVRVERGIARSARSPARLLEPVLSPVRFDAVGSGPRSPARNKPRDRGLDALWMRSGPARGCAHPSSSTGDWFNTDAPAHASPGCAAGSCCSTSGRRAAATACTCSTSCARSRPASPRCSPSSASTRPSSRTRPTATRSRRRSSATTSTTRCSTTRPSPCGASTPSGPGRRSS